MGLERGDVEAALDRQVDFVLPLDTGVPLAVNQATPAVLGEDGPASRRPCSSSPARRPAST